MTAAPPTVRVVGRYALYQALAAGGMATVYLGRLLGPVGFARTVAIKRLHPQYAADPEFVAMFLDEARLAARIRHPNVVPTLDVVATKGELFLVMDYVHGESVAKLVRTAAQQEQAIPVQSVVAILSGALQGLEAAHNATSERGVPLRIVHRDVSPQNILLGTDGQPRLLDFGVARAMGRSHTTQQGMIKGKIAYMPPEQVRGEELGPATDVYSAGVVLWEALVGRRLYGMDQHAELVYAVLAANARPPSEALLETRNDARANEVAPLDGVVMRALAPKRENRFQSAREFARALEAALPPASAAQVSDWVQRVAGEALRARAVLVAEIESSSAIELTKKEIGQALADTEESSLRADPRGSSATREVPLTAMLGRGTPHSTNPLNDEHDPTIRQRAVGTQFHAAHPTQAPPAARSPLAATRLSAGSPEPVSRDVRVARAPVAATLESMPSVSSAEAAALASARAFAPLVGGPLVPPEAHGRRVSTVPSAIASKRHRTKLIVTAVVSGLVVAAVGILAVAAFALSSNNERAGAGALAPALSALSEAPSSAPPAPSVAPATPLPSASASVAPAPVAPAPIAPTPAPPTPVTPPDPVPPAAPARPSRPPAKSGGRAPKPTAASCDPPFTYDKDGLKHYKDECF